MDAYFIEMLGRLKLKKAQRADAKAKYNRIAKALHDEFYTTKYDGKTKLLIGSYGKKTNIRPPQDVDLLFKIPVDTYEQYEQYNGNGASALLQKIRRILDSEYETSETPKAWGKVVLVKFPDGKYDIELLPAYEVGDGVYKIPNTEDGGFFEDFDVGSDLAVVFDSNKETGGVTRRLIKMVKKWKPLHSSLHTKSFEIESFVADYLKSANYDKMSWAERIAGFFEWLQVQPNLHQDDVSLVKNAAERARKAVNYENADKIADACAEWKKVFDNAFPAYNKNKCAVHNLTLRWQVNDEMYIEDNYDVKINPTYNLSINAEVEAKKFRQWPLTDFISKYTYLPKHAKVHFKVKSDVPEPVEYHWKVRNFGAQAASTQNGLRGEIRDRGVRITESTLYQGTHYVEVYVIKDDKCVVKAMRFVPIGDKEDL
ncbi:hypothetical protein CVV43_04125 [Candidatus Saccharibacteria bacterium HGW-Saccharibacteria-1]|jgi:hypothetical protein|nr:MAG: hypothetical protein CVV43_04125 [Candidatus Saccharibacteria bacterium HGW-Saccharibacteria-1]